MGIDKWIIWFLLFSCLSRAYEASDGASDPSYRTCAEQCENTGCVGGRCFSHCKLSSDSSSLDGPWYMQKHFYQKLRQWFCQSDCQYLCMAEREKERAEHGEEPVKYNGKWLLQHFYCLQEPVSVALSALNFVLHFHGWRSFLSHVYTKLPLGRDKRPFYDNTGLWTLYAFFSMNSCLWAAVYHSRDMYLTQILVCSSWVALLGYSLVLALIRSFSLSDIAARVMISAPLIAFTTTHILYLANYQMDLEWNAKVCISMATAELIIWFIWATVTRHPSKIKLWTAIAGGGLGIFLFLKMHDFPPYKGMVDAQALWHAVSIPVTCIWWSFAKDDATYRTSFLMKKVK